ncbi:uncharacterized protein LOC110100610 [Dendrobium catenatum]|uniref:uncharacterized protein LOC110100610 n=1 Tax=Dendrobium catenatum TaxID=906689 RepID=UPI0009F5382A|nr:uncharacterized protein LOC110100610 [Dendrobium catenatum]
MDSPTTSKDTLISFVTPSSISTQKIDRSIEEYVVRIIFTLTEAIDEQFAGLAFAPLYFYNGGVREFLATLKQHVFVVRSADDPNVFLLNDFQDPLQKSLSSLELPRVLSVANGTPMQGSPNEVSSIYDSMRVDGITASGTSSAFEYRGRHRRKTHDPTHDLSIHVMEKFSLVTKFAREATTQLFGEFHESHELLHDRKQKDSSPLDSGVVSQPNDTQSKADNIVATSDSTELDKLSLVWGKPRQPPLNHEEVNSYILTHSCVVVLACDH